MSEVQLLEQKVEALAKKWETDLSAVWGRVHAWLDMHLSEVSKAATADIKTEESHVESVAGKDIETAAATVGEAGAEVKAAPKS